MDGAPDIFTSLDVNLTLLAVIAFFSTLIIYGIFSAILVYHWRQYAIGARVIRLTLTVYFVSTGILFLIATGSLFFI